jgi:hypothetical protein
LKRVGWLGLLVFLLLLPESIRAQGEGILYLKALEKKYAGLQDYTVDVTVHFDIETFKAPDLQAKIYYKVPDKLKIESKRVLFFPREGGYFNPALFKTEDYTVLLLEHLTYDGKKAATMRLIPKRPKSTIHDMVLTLDVEQTRVREIKVARSGGGEIKAEILYGSFDRFELPTRINLLLDFPTVVPEIKGFQPPADGTKRVTGRIEMTYSNYKINSGLRDDLFKETDLQRP